MQNRAEQLAGITERRSIALDEFELRSEGSMLHFRGYASLFDTPYEMYGGPDKGGWVETVNRQAFKRTLAAKPDVVLNLNHGASGTGLPMARTTSGTLQLRTDAKGLLPEADLDLRDPDVQALQVKVDRGDVNQMSFAFRTIGQKWDDEEANRELTELSLDHGDVSIVTTGANQKTSFQLRGLDEAIALLSSMDPDQAATEIRAMASHEMDQVSAAHTLLGHLMGLCDPGTDSGGYVQGTLSAPDDGVELRAKYTEADRKKLAKSGEAMPDGSYPIVDVDDLKNAIRAVGRGGSSHDAIRRHIIKRAKALGQSNLIPSDWGADGSISGKNSKPLTLSQAKRLAILDIA